MKRQYILAIVAFSATFIFSAMLHAAISPFFVEVSPLPVSFWRLQEKSLDSTAKKIRFLLERDHQYGLEHTRKQSRLVRLFGEDSLLENLRRQSSSTEEYVSRMESLATDGLPRDVARAWRAHKNAWQRHANFLQRLEVRSDWQLVEEDLNSSLDEQNEDISSTYHDLLEIARTHGVDFQD